MSLLTERYADKIINALSCYDRIIIQGTLPGLCHAKGMTNYLNFHHIRIFDYPRSYKGLNFFAAEDQQFSVWGETR